jgi:hypothetical protein
LLFQAVALSVFFPLRANDIGFASEKLGQHFFIHPVDMQMGKNGELYLLKYETPWYDGTDGTLKKITYIETPIEIG